MQKNEIIKAYELINQYVKEKHTDYEIYLKHIVNDNIEVQLKLKESRIKRPTLFLTFTYKDNNIVLL